MSFNAVNNKVREVSFHAVNIKVREVSFHAVNTIRNGRFPSMQLILRYGKCFFI